MTNPLFSKSVSLFILLAPGLALGDCTELYRAEVAELKAVSRAAQITTVNTTSGAALATGVMLAAGAVAFPPLILAGSGAAVGGVRMGIAKRKLRSKLLALALLTESEKGSGKTLRRMTKRLEKRNPSITEADVAEWVRMENRVESFCPVDEAAGAQRTLSFRLIVKMANEQQF